MQYKTIPESIPSTGILYVDHQKNLRSGHLGHALVEYKSGCVLSFYSNCSGTRNAGHSGFGWVEYKRSTDGGDTWGDAKVLEYSYDAFINQPFTVSCEKAVSTKENEIVLFCLRNLNANGWEPHLSPVVLRSEDGGVTWSEPVEVCEKRGRIYDALVRNGVIYLLLCEGVWKVEKPEDGYYLYKSEDSGKTFSLVSQVPAVSGNAYGDIEILDDGALICYIYNQKDEYNLDYSISRDMGKTWTQTGKSHVAKRIRNPQIAKVRDGYFLHGRAGCESDELPFYFVLYTSKDGICWDEGVYLCDVPGQCAYYSNNLVMTQKDGSQRVLIQASVSYDGGKVNVAHWFLHLE